MNEGKWWPTPAVNDMGESKSPAEWDAWTAAMRERLGRRGGGMMSDANDYFIREAEKKMERYADNGNLSAYLRVKKQRDRMIRERAHRMSEKLNNISDTLRRAMYDPCPRCGGPLVDPTPRRDHHDPDDTTCGPCAQSRGDRDYDRLREREDG